MAHHSRGAYSRFAWFDMRADWHWRHESCPVCMLADALERWLDEPTDP